MSWKARVIDFNIMLFPYNKAHLNKYGSESKRISQRQTKFKEMQQHRPSKPLMLETGKVIQWCNVSLILRGFEKCCEVRST